VEARKAFKMAFKLDDQNMGLLQQLANLEL
jgi:hypothetical protein